MEKLKEKKNRLQNLPSYITRVVSKENLDTILRGNVLPTEKELESQDQEGGRWKGAWKTQDEEGKPVFVGLTRKLGQVGSQGRSKARNATYG